MSTVTNVVKGKYKIVEECGFFKFELYANNGQLLYESREYATANSCKSGIETFKKNVEIADCRVDKDKNGNFRYIIKKGNSIYVGESYSTKTSAENSAESVRKFAGVSPLVEETATVEDTRNCPVKK